MQAFKRRVLFQMLPMLLVALAIAGHARPALAIEYFCFENLDKCYYRAAARDSWVDMWLAGLDCELTWVNCVRTALVY
jgi:hypothetical protein